MMRGTNTRDDDAVTVIVGTLMLILVTVTAAAGLAVMVSQMQKDEMNRQAHQAAVKNELLKITGIRPVYDPVTGILQETNITVLNLNTADSRINMVGIGDNSYPRNFSSGGTLYPNPNAGFDVPAAKQSEIHLNLTKNFAVNPNISAHEPLRVFVITSYYNTFERTFTPPLADFSFRIESEDLGVAERDVIVLDGSSSTDDGAIVNWTWSVRESNASLAILTGKTARFVPRSKGPFDVNLTVIDDTSMKSVTPTKSIPLNSRFFPATYLKGSVVGNDMVATVTDLNDLPVANVTVTFIKFYDVHGNLSLSRYSDMTNGEGKVNVTVLGGEGTVRIESGKILPVYIPVKYSP